MNRRDTNTYRPEDNGGHKGIARFKVASVSTGTVTAHRWNGTTAGVTNYVIKTMSTKVVGDEIYAYPPIGGTSAAGAVWMEVSGAAVATGPQLLFAKTTTGDSRASTGLFVASCNVAAHQAAGVVLRWKLGLFCTGWTLGSADPLYQLINDDNLGTGFSLTSLASITSRITTLGSGYLGRWTSIDFEITCLDATHISTNLNYAEISKNGTTHGGGSPNVEIVENFAIALGTLRVKSFGTDGCTLTTMTVEKLK